MSTSPHTPCAPKQEIPLWEEQLNQYLDGELPSGQQAALFGHLAACSSCRRAMDSILEFRRVAREEYLALPISADERFFERLAELKERRDRMTRDEDREPLWNSRRPVSLGATVAMAFSLFLLGLYLPRFQPDTDVGRVRGEQELVDLEAPVYGILNTIYVITPGVTIESARPQEVESP